jgi:hypothetical protein
VLWNQHELSLCRLIQFKEESGRVFQRQTCKQRTQALSIAGLATNATDTAQQLWCTQAAPAAGAQLYDLSVYQLLHTFMINSTPAEACIRMPVDAAAGSFTGSLPLQQQQQGAPQTTRQEAR